jgi:hypothetical protein
MTLGNAKNTPSILAYKQRLQLGGSSQESSQDKCKVKQCVLKFTCGRVNKGLKPLVDHKWSRFVGLYY